MDNTLKFINTLNKENKVILACSGGPDSMCLLDLLIKNGFKVVVAHVNHKIRIESDDEYVFLKKYCKEKNVIFEGINYESGSIKNFHNDARIYRYNFFYSLVSKYKAEYLFTAHHGDDLMETILMRIMRGSTINGYAGFSFITNKKNFKIIRPLLYLSKDQIEEYDKENKIPYVIDESNKTDHYTRNRYRHSILPFLKEEYDLAHLKFLNFSNKLKKEQDYISKIVDGYLNKMFKENCLDLKYFRNVDSFIQEYIIERILDKLYPTDLYCISSSNTEEILKAITSSKQNITINLPNNLVAIKEYNKMIFKNNIVENNNYEYILDKEIDTKYFKIYISDETSDTSNFTIRLNSKDICLPLIIRTKNTCDRIEVKNLGNYKKVSKIFIDEKIPSREREMIPIVLDSNGYILWVPGLKKSKKDVPIDESYDIILKYEKKERNYNE